MTAMEDQRQIIFETIKPFYKTFQSSMIVTVDETDKYYLGTHEVRQKDGYRTAFGGVEIKKNYVSAHLMPVYAYPDMLDTLSPALKKRMQGKSCFNFKRVDNSLFAELAELIEKGAERFRQDGRI